MELLPFHNMFFLFRLLFSHFPTTAFWNNGQKELMEVFSLAPTL